MRKAQIFDGQKFIDVTEGSLFRISQVWPAEVGGEITFSIRQGVYVEAKVIFKDGTGSTFQVIRIRTDNDLDEMIVTAEDVSVEVLPNMETKYEFSKKDSKKVTIEKIKEYNLNININQTKAKIFEELEGLNNVVII